MGQCKFKLCKFRLLNRVSVMCHAAPTVFVLLVFILYIPDIMLLNKIFIHGTGLSVVLWICGLTSIKLPVNQNLKEKHT